MGPVILEERRRVKPALTFAGGGATIRQQMSVRRWLLNTAERLVPLTWVRRWANRSLDRFHGLETHGNVELAELGLAEQERVHYAPSSWFTLARVAEVIPFDGHDVFVDFGSGKGRQVVLAARRYPFQRVVGVEISAALNEIARANVERNRRRLRCRNVELITGDVLEFEPPADMTIAYFYSPFTGSIFQRVIERIGRSWATRANRRLWLVLQRPVRGLPAEQLATYQGAENALRSAPWLEPVRTLTVRGSGEWTTEITVYRARP